MRIINFAETNSIINQYVAEIRDVRIQQDRMRFRCNNEHLAKLFPSDEVSLWCAVIDPELNEHLYIVPG